MTGFSDYVGIPQQGCGDLQLSWDKLKEKAKELGYIVSNNGYTIMSNDPDVYTYTMFYSKDGVINVKHYDKVCFVADHRTPDQMWQIMEALRK